MLALLTLIVVLAAFFLLRPKQDPPPPADTSSLGTPKAEQGEEIGRVYGSAWLSDVQVHWWGDIKTEPIKSKGGKK